MNNEREHMRRCLIRQLLRWRTERGDGWLREYVAGWKRWNELRGDFWKQARAGNTGAAAGRWVESGEADG